MGASCGMSMGFGCVTHLYALFAMQLLKPEIQ
jgi:hypothetical protein